MREPIDADQALKELTAGAVAFVPGADHAGVTVVHRGQEVETAAATHRYAIELDNLQREHREGPCLSAAWEHFTISSQDLLTERRWPTLSADATTTTPIRSMLCFQLFTDDKFTGALNFYAERPDAFDDRSVEQGLIFATHAALAWNLLRRKTQFRSALATRDIIGQAKGMLIERFDIDAVQAFDLLKRLSQTSNTPLVDIATRVVDAGSAKS